MLSEGLRNRTIKNIGWLIAGKVAQAVISLFISALTARYLQPVNMGYIDYAGAYLAFFSALCMLGINSVLMKEFVENPGQDGKIVGTCLVLRIVASLLSVVTIFCVTCIVDAGETLKIQVVVLSSLGLLFHMYEIFYYWFQSRLESKIPAMVMLAAFVVMAGYKAVLLLLQKSVGYFAFATSVDYVCISVALLLFYRKKGGGRLHFSWEYGKQLLSKSCHFIVPGVMLVLYAQTDRFMLMHMVSSEETAYYSRAVWLCTSWCFVLSAIIDSVYPSIMKANAESSRNFERYNRILYASVFYIALLASVMITIFAPLLITFLYSAQWLRAAVPLRIVTWYTAFAYLGTARDAWIVCKNRQKYLLLIYASAAVVNIGMNFLLIPRWGANGAAVASLVAQLTATFLVPACIPKMRENVKLMLQAITLRGLRQPPAEACAEAQRKPSAGETLQLDSRQVLFQLVRSGLTGQAELLLPAYSLQEITSAAYQHQIVPIVYLGAVNCGVSPALPQMQDMLTTTGKMISLEENQTLEVARICAAFEREKITYAALKGIVIRKLYPNPAMRVMSDADILIHREQYKQAKEVLPALGFRHVKDSDHEYTWQSPLLRLELHRWLIPSNNKDFFDYYQEGWQLLKPSAEGAYSCVFSDEDQYLYLFTHLAKHYRDGGIGIKHFIDLWVYRREKPLMNEAYLHAELKKLRLETFYANVCRVLSVWFEKAEPDEITDYITDAVFAGGAYGAMNTHILSAAVRTGSGTAQSKQHKHLRKRLFPPLRKMRMRYPFLSWLPIALPVMWAVRFVSATVPRRKLRKVVKEIETVKPQSIDEYRTSLELVGLRFYHED